MQPTDQFTLSQRLAMPAMIAATSEFADLIHSAIATNPYLAGRKLRYEAESGRVVLQGTVSTYFQKQMAQEALRRIDGVCEIENQLEVSWS
jgi:osmotically-inducible protein OsmY